MSNLTTLYKTNFRNIPATLRVIADGIEAGEYDDIDVGLVVLAGQGVFETFTLGRTTDPAVLAGLFLAGANRMANSIEEYGYQDAPVAPTPAA